MLLESSNNFAVSISADYPKREGSDFEYKIGPFGTPYEVSYVKSLCTGDFSSFASNNFCFFGIPSLLCLVFHARGSVVAKFLEFSYRAI